MTTTRPESDAIFVTAPSLAQRRMWILEQLDAGATTYHVQAGLRFRGPLDVGALGRALDEIVARHEVLRTRLVDSADGLAQHVWPARPVALEHVDLGSADPEATLRRLAAAEVRRPFDLSAEQPLRAILGRAGDEHHVLVVTLDHIVCDARSVSVFHDELCALYRAFHSGGPSPLDPPVIQYADYAAWQREWLDGPEVQRQLAYWVDRMSPTPPRLDLPSRRGGHRSSSSASHSQQLAPDLMERLRALALAERASLFSVLLTAFAVVLGRMTGESDLAIGSLLEGRTEPELESLIGFFVNTVALRVDVSGDPTFRELLARVRDSVLDAYANQDLPFDRLVEELRPARDAGPQPLFDVMFQLAEIGRATELLPSGSIEPFALDMVPAPVDLAVGVLGDGGRHHADWDYNEGLFSKVAIERMQEQFRTVLEAVATDPSARLSALPMVGAQEREALLRWGSARSARGVALVHDELAECVRERPDAVAVVAGGVAATYRELSDWSDRLAVRLRGLGVGRGALAGIFLLRGLDALVAELAVLKAGAAFLPLDPTYPADRVRLMVEDAAPAVVVTNAELAGALSCPVPVTLVGDLSSQAAGVEESATPVAPDVGADDAAYVIYTSGSTGRPKAAVMTHGGMAHIIGAQRRCFELGPDDRILQFASLSFDASVFELLLAIGCGGTLVVGEPDGVNPTDLTAFLREHAVTAVVLPPVVLALLPDDADLPELRTVMVAGDTCSPTLAARWRAGRRFFNLYGPTETTIWATAHEVGPPDAGASTLSIGQPVTGATAYVVDEQLQLAPVGAAGELVVGGPGVARGYLGRPSLTADRFVPDPYGAHPGARLYRTGDLARWREDGSLAFLGRIDNQVKLRGFRVELGEIESRLSAHRAVTDAVATVREEDDQGNQVLTAYVVVVGAVPIRELRAHCAETLPDFMVPSVIVTVDALPTGPNGKVDRRALPAPGAAAGEGGAAYVAPRTDLEQIVADIWADVLGRPRVGALDDFFALGGHSLAATRVITRFRADFGVRVPVRSLFDSPVLADFTEAVVGVIEGDSEAAL